MFILVFALVPLLVKRPQNPLLLDYFLTFLLVYSYDVSYLLNNFEKIY